MTIKLAINGLGRIGRCVIRAIEEEQREDVQVVVVNGPAPTPTHRHLLAYDSVHGRFPGVIEADGDVLVINDRRVPVLHERDPLKINWADYGVDVVLECTGIFRTREEASVHLKQGAKKVLISAPSPDADSTIVYGVNNEVYQPSHDVVSVGSCTTNGLAPVAKVIDAAFGIERGFMTTIHSYTADQNVVDGTHKDLRRARACAMSMVPTSTGAAKAIGVVLPSLKGKLDGIAIRVPTPNVSLVDLTVDLAKPTTKEEVNSMLAEAAECAMDGVMETTNEPIVSVDMNHHSASSIVDLGQTYVTGGTMLRVGAWYDNEWGFSNRMLDVAALVMRK